MTLVMPPHLMVCPKSAVPSAPAPPPPTLSKLSERADAPVVKTQLTNVGLFRPTSKVTGIDAGLSKSMWSMVGSWMPPWVVQLYAQGVLPLYCVPDGNVNAGAVGTPVPVTVNHD